MNDQSDLPPELHDLPTEQLKHGTGKFSHIILVPQPSDDPNDPLNVCHTFVPFSCCSSL